MVGEFHLGGAVRQQVADGDDGDGMLDEIGVVGLRFTFIPNVPFSQGIPSSDGILHLKSRTVEVRADGTFVEVLDDGSLSSFVGINPAANSPALNLEGELKYTVKYERLESFGGRSGFKPPSWTFVAPEPGWEGNLGDVAPVVDASSPVVTRGPKGDKGDKGDEGEKGDRGDG